VLLCHGVADDGACTCGKGTCDSIGKHPIYCKYQEHGHLEPITDEATLEQALKEHPYANLAVVNGRRILILDRDRRNGGEESWQRLRDEHEDEPIPHTLTNISGDGFHSFLGLEKDIPLKTKLAKGIDIPPYVIVPPSRHASGHIYRFEDASQPVELAPQWLVRRAEKQIRSKVAAKLVRKSIPEAEQPEYPEPDSSLDDEGQLYDAFVRLGWIGNGDGEKFNVRCPQNHLHSNPLPDGADPTSSTVVWTNGSFYCAHGHCEDLTHAEVRRLLGIASTPRNTDRSRLPWYCVRYGLRRDRRLKRCEPDVRAFFWALYDLAGELRDRGMPSGEICFAPGEPFSDEELADETALAPEIIKRGLLALLSVGLVGRKDDGVLVVTDFHSSQRTKVRENPETVRKRVAAWRAERKDQADDTERARGRGNARYMGSDDQDQGADVLRDMSRKKSNGVGNGLLRALPADDGEVTRVTPTVTGRLS